MRRLISLPVLLFVIAAVSSAPAQNPDIFVAPIPDNPFTGTVNVERSFVQKDGQIVKSKTAREIGRDSRGRIFNEMRTLVPAASNESPEVVGIHIYDPETRVTITVNDRQHTFRKGTVNRPPEAVPPSFLSASSGLNTLPQNQFTREEDLGNKVMEGLSVHGVRQSQTVPTVNGGNGVNDANGGKGVVITDEYWYSEDLRINLVLKHNDPRTGGVTMTVTGVKCSEPDPARFEIPAGYTPAGVRQEE